MEGCPLRFGLVDQLEDRLVCNEEAEGSNPSQSIDPFLFIKEKCSIPKEKGLRGLFSPGALSK
jgi:hypothetical protein